MPGPDGGKGGKFLLLPPGYAGTVPDGHYVYRSGTNNVFIFLRSFYSDPKDTKPAVDRIKQVKIHPLGQQATAKAMEFPDASGKSLNMLPRSDASAFQQIKDLLDTEGAALAEPDWLGMLNGIGIAAGKPEQNADGSTDVFIGPKAPAGKERNWLATASGRGFFAILRLYLPEEAALNGSWKPSDIQKIQ